MVSDSDSEMNDLPPLTINEHFAGAFEYKKGREELAKLHRINCLGSVKDKYRHEYSAGLFRCRRFGKF